MSELSYILLSNVYICLFGGVYALFFRGQTFFQLNRFYLLGSLLLSFVIPLIQNPWLQTLGLTRQIQYTITLQTVTITGDQHISADHFTIDQLITWVYFAGVLFSAAG